MPEIRTSKIERVDRRYTDGVARVRLADGSSVRMDHATASALLAHTNALVAYDIDAFGNRYNPRAAQPHEIARARG